MKALMIGGDPGVLDPNTETGKRIAEYRQVLGEIDVLLAYGGVRSLIVAFFAGFKMLRHKKPARNATHSVAGGYDVITAQGPEHYLLAWVFSKISGVPWQMQIHADIFSPFFVGHSMFDKNRLRVWLTKFLLPRADCIRAVSERIKNSILRTSQVPKDLRCQIIVLPIFVDTEKIKNAPIKTDLHKKYPGRFIILMASRITKEKNIRLAIEVMREIPPPGVNSPSRKKSPLLLIVGDGPELKNLKILNTKYQLLNTVIFESHTSDLASYYKTCDLFLLTSNYEGYGRTLIEAAAAGAKIVSSDVGIAYEILEPENIFKVCDKNDLVEKLMAAMNGPIKPPKYVIPQTKEEYLRLYLDSFKRCLKK